MSAMGQKWTSKLGGTYVRSTFKNGVSNARMLLGAVRACRVCKAGSIG